jgi:hypothetical protein
MNQHVGKQAFVPDTDIDGGAGSVPLRVLKVLVIVAEILLVANALTSHAWELLVLGHITIVAGLIMILVALEQGRAETSALQTFILLTFAGGPVGAAAALFGEQQIWRLNADTLTKWYDTIAPADAPAVTLVDQIIDGRLVRQQSRLPRPFETLLNTGTMQEKQALLAYLAIQGDEELVEAALVLALRSPDQRVRVQAAAVAAHTRARARRNQAKEPTAR